MTLQLSIRELLQLAPKMEIKEAAAYILAIERLMPEGDIDTLPRIAAFLSLLIIESNQFRKGRQRVSDSGWNNERHAAREMLLDGFNKEKKRVLQLKVEAGEFRGKDKELAMFLYGKHKFLGNDTDEDGWTYRGAFFSRRHGKLRIMEMVERAMELAEKNNWPYDELSRGMDPEILLVHPYLNVYSVFETWNFKSGNKWADEGKIGQLLMILSNHPQQQNKMLRLYDEALSLVVAKRQVSM